MRMDPRYENPVSVIGRAAIRKAWKAADKYARVPGLRALVRKERCVGCGACVRKGFCRFGAISMGYDRKAAVDDRACRGCTRCTHLCPENAFTMEIRPPAMVKEALKGLDAEISRALKQDGR